MCVCVCPITEEHIAMRSSLVYHTPLPHSTPSSPSSPSSPPSPLSSPSSPPPYSGTLLSLLPPSLQWHSPLPPPPLPTVALSSPSSSPPPHSPLLPPPHPPARGPPTWRREDCPGERCLALSKRHQKWAWPSRLAEDWPWGVWHSLVSL